MRIGELAKRSGLSAYTIRYYERIGLLPHADRDKSGQRDYDRSILTWIEFLDRLKTTGMPIRDMVHYAALRARGAGTEPQRRDMLIQHREHVRARLSALSECLLVLDAKIDGYAASTAGTRSDEPTLSTQATTPGYPKGLARMRAIAADRAAKTQEGDHS